MSIEIINNNQRSSNIEQSSGSKVKEVKTPFEIQFQIEQRRNSKAIENNKKAEILRPWIIQLSNLVNSRNIEGLQGLFIKWATGVGFKNQQIAEYLEDKLFIKNNWLTFSKIVCNTYLELFDDCNKKQRGLKFQKIQYQFEKTPMSKEAISKAIAVEIAIKNFVFQQNN